jgi:hypothetical protein
VFVPRTWGICRLVAAAVIPAAASQAAVTLYVPNPQQKPPEFNITSSFLLLQLSVTLLRQWLLLPALEAAAGSLHS